MQRHTRRMTSEANKIVGLYQRHARAWTRARGRRLTEKWWLDRFAELPHPSGHVLDIGCGSGEPIAHYLAEKGYSITGVDSSPEMIKMFRANLPEQTGIVADMRSLQLGRRFQGLLAWDSFFHLGFDDQRAMFKVFNEHAGFGAPLMFTSGPEEGEAIGTLEGEPLYHASLAPSEYRSLLKAAGFEVVAHAAKDPTCGGRTIWLAVRQ
jgi:SAM-dependent methyltransferase